MSRIFAPYTVRLPLLALGLDVANVGSMHLIAGSEDKRTTPPSRGWMKRRGGGYDEQIAMLAQHQTDVIIGRAA